MSESVVIDQPTAQTASETPKPRKLPPNWEQIEADYIRGASIRVLAAKYDIAFGTMNSRAVRGQWEQKRQLSDDIAHSVLQAEHSTECITPYSEVKPYASVASSAIDQVTESLKWKERAYKNALKIVDGLERQEYGDGHTKRLAEAASALASIDATARRQLGLDVSDAEDFGDSPRSMRHKIGERPIMRRAQVIEVQAADVQPSPESFDPSI